MIQMRHTCCHSRLTEAQTVAGFERGRSERMRIKNNLMHLLYHGLICLQLAWHGMQMNLSMIR